MIWELLKIYFLVVNVITFLSYGMDKRKAIRAKRRISEKTLLFMAAIGGSIGALAGMYIFHHKTKKIKFSLGIPVIMILQFVIVLGIYKMF